MKNIKKHLLNLKNKSKNSLKPLKKHAKVLISKEKALIKKIENSRYRSTTILAILFLTLHLFCQLIPDLTILLSFKTDSSPIGLLITSITSAFIHASWAHLLGNMFVFIPALLFIEHRLGSRLTMMAYLFCAFGSGLVTFVSIRNIADPLSALILLMSTGGNIAGLGSSGAGFGIVAIAMGLMLTSGIEMFLAIFALGPILLRELIKINFFLDGIGHSAHAGGILFGLLFLIIAFNRKLISSNKS